MKKVVLYSLFLSVFFVVLGYLSVIGKSVFGLDSILYGFNVGFCLYIVLIIVTNVIVLVCTKYVVRSQHSQSHKKLALVFIANAITVLLLGIWNATTEAKDYFSLGYLSLAINLLVTAIFSICYVWLIPIKLSKFKKALLRLFIFFTFLIIGFSFNWFAQMVTFKFFSEIFDPLLPSIKGELIPPKTKFGYLTTKKTVTYQSTSNFEVTFPKEWSITGIEDSSNKDGLRYFSLTTSDGKIFSFLSEYTLHTDYSKSEPVTTNREFNGINFQINEYISEEKPENLEFVVIKMMIPLRYNNKKPYIYADEYNDFFIVCQSQCSGKSISEVRSNYLKIISNIKLL